MNIHTDDTKIITFLKYGIRWEYSQWSQPRGLGNIRFFNKNMNCCIILPTILSTNRKFTQRPKSAEAKKQNPRRKENCHLYSYPQHSHQSAFEVLTALLMILIQCSLLHILWKVFTAHHRAIPTQYAKLPALVQICHTKSFETKSVANQTEVETWDTQTDYQITSFWWNAEFAIAEFEQQNKKLLVELKNLNIFLRCANRSQANANA